MSRWRRDIAMTVGLCCCFGLAACGSDDSSSDAAQSHATALEQAAGGTVEPGTATTGADYDACALLSDADVFPLIGVSVPGESTSTNPEVPSCLWENPDTYTSVSVEISSPDTAPENTLPDPDPAMQTRPAPDGMRYFMTGVVEFAADDRVVTVQVANLSGGEASDAAALALAQKIKAEMS